MVFLFWDASALVKRYYLESGSDVVGELFAQIPSSQMALTVPGYAETVFALIRKRNRGELSATGLNLAISILDRETILSRDFGLIEVNSDDVFDSIRLIRAQNVNASDASTVVAILRFIRTSALPGANPLFVASDHRLLRAAKGEGLATLNPEAIGPSDVPVFLAAL